MKQSLILSLLFFIVVLSGCDLFFQKSFFSFDDKGSERFGSLLDNLDASNPDQRKEALAAAAKDPDKIKDLPKEQQEVLKVAATTSIDASIGEVTGLIEEGVDFANMSEEDMDKLTENLDETVNAINVLTQTMTDEEIIDQYEDVGLDQETLSLVKDIADDPAAAMEAFGGGDPGDFDESNFDGENYDESSFENYEY